MGVKSPRSSSGCRSEGILKKKYTGKKLNLVNRFSGDFGLFRDYFF
jgi:hypothetical protein